MDNVIKAAGSGAMNTTLSATAAADKGYNGNCTVVRLGITADLFDADSVVFIANSTNYNGMRTIVNAPTNYIDINTSDGFTAETTSTADTVRVGFQVKGRALFKGFHFKLNVAPTTSENFTVDLDAAAGSDYDDNFYTKDLSSLSTSNIVNMFEVPIILETGDIVIFGWANTDTKTWGLKMIYSEGSP